ncbi:MAG: hypothetical protein ACRD0K_27760, partial [Egibacteraceae bacterium]
GARLGAQRAVGRSAGGAVARFADGAGVAEAAGDLEGHGAVTGWCRLPVERGWALSGRVGAQPVARWRGSPTVPVPV